MLQAPLRWKPRVVLGIRGTLDSYNGLNLELMRSISQLERPDGNRIQMPTFGSPRIANQPRFPRGTVGRRRCA